MKTMKVVWLGKERKTKERKKAGKEIGKRLLEGTYRERPKLRERDASSANVSIEEIGKPRSTKELMKRMFADKGNKVSYRSPAIAKLERQKRAGKRVFV